MAGCPLKGEIIPVGGRCVSSEQGSEGDNDSRLGVWSGDSLCLPGMLLSRDQALVLGHLNRCFQVGGGGVGSRLYSQDESSMGCVVGGPRPSFLTQIIYFHLTLWCIPNACAVCNFFAFNVYCRKSENGNKQN